MSARATPGLRGPRAIAARRVPSRARSDRSMLVCNSRQDFPDHGERSALARATGFSQIDTIPASVTSVEAGSPRLTTHCTQQRPCTFRSTRSTLHGASGMRTSLPALGHSNPRSASASSVSRTRHADVEALGALGARAGQRKVHRALAHTAGLPISPSSIAASNPRRPRRWARRRSSSCTPRRRAKIDQRW